MDEKNFMDGLIEHAKMMALGSDFLVDLSFYEAHVRGIEEPPIDYAFTAPWTNAIFRNLPKAEKYLGGHKLENLLIKLPGTHYFTGKMDPENWGTWNKEDRTECMKYLMQMKLCLNKEGGYRMPPALEDIKRGDVIQRSFTLLYLPKKGGERN